ncbi:prepilin-type N-terminal cleavage/methylation domain-containing protein [Fontisphaera persica]|uniref:type IV pilus modification PilV family protein n=1 Tax=Fontisphaera persica TaxID=2974023 RepID=UPI0024C02FD4|nr:prepilin-type N-terminal cleavage/methylation domain-containing protein [Fontisphaera persica]WCJ58032.1 prepilin-type N-terminal cleavage/methylation domain-containing protein [Fontisphaera persica]
MSVPPRFPLTGVRRARCAFTLVEVMIAVGIFFIALLSILGVMTRGLAAARGLQISAPDTGMLAAERYVTNMLDEATSRGDFGDAYPGFTWERDEYPVASNGLWRVDFFVFKQSQRGPQLYDTLSIWLYKPDSKMKGGISRPAFEGDTFGFRE